MKNTKVLLFKPVALYVITEIIIEMVRMSCLREEYGEFMHLV